MELEKETFRSRELDVAQVNVIVTPKLECGRGAIGTDVSPDQATERGNTLPGYLEDATPGAGCGCIDGRCVLHTMAGQEAKLGPKLAGGNGLTTLFALALENYFDDDGSALMHFGRAINILEHQGNPIRMHTDEHTYGNIEAALAAFASELDSMQSLKDFIGKVEAADFAELLGDDKLKTACGMADGFEGAFANMSRRPQDIKDEATGEVRKETAEEVQQRLDFIKVTTFVFNEADDAEAEATFERHVDRATVLDESGFFKDFSSIKLSLIMARVLRDQGSTDSVLDRIDVLQNNGEGVHGHTEWGVAGVSKKLRGKVLNTSRYTRERRDEHGRSLEVFGIELWATEDNADAFATGPKAAAQKLALVQGQVSAQVAGYVSLGDGSQHGVLLTAA